MNRMIIALLLVLTSASASAQTRVSALTAASALDGTELLYCVQGSADRKCTATQIKTLTSASPTLVTPILGIATGTSLSLSSTTDSSSTSTGALIVAGGVGVEKRLSAASAVIGNGADTTHFRITGLTNGLRIFTSADGTVLDGISADGFSSYQPVSFNGSTFTLRTGNVAAISINASQQATFAASVAITGALSIGNTVNAVSPTSPNRTVTIVIGGTTYYIPAKLTND